MSERGFAQPLADNWQITPSKMVNEPLHVLPITTSELPFRAKEQRVEISI